MGGTKTSKFHDAWTYERLGPFIYGFRYTKIFEHIRNMDTFWKYIMFINLMLKKTKLSKLLDILEKGGHR